MDESIPTMIEEIERSRIERARQASDEEKFLAGYELHRRVVMSMESGIRSDFPNADDAEVRRILLHRLALSDEGYGPV